PSVPGDEDRLSSTVEAIAESRNDGTVIHIKRCDLQAVMMVDGSLLNNVRVDGGSGSGLILRKIAADMNICGEELDHAIRQLVRSFRAVELERNSTTLQKPSRVEEVGQSAGVVGVEMRKEDRLNVRHARLQRRKPHGHCA